MTPRSGTAYDPMKPRKIRGSGPKIPWERYAVWGAIAVVLILVIWLVIYVKGQPKLSDPIRIPATGSYR